MQKPEWPGIATAVGIVLILTMIFWLQLNGPVNLDRVREWQTLLAGVFALVAAAIAYRGATAKVRFDRAIAMDELKRKRLVLYLKLGFVLERLFERARLVGEKLDWKNGKVEFTRSDIEIKEPVELEETWQYLDIFPPVVIGEIRTIRYGLSELSGICERLGEGTISVESNGDSSMREHAKSCVENIWTACAVAYGVLKPVIEELAPSLHSDERLLRAFDTSDH